MQLIEEIPAIAFCQFCQTNWSLLPNSDEDGDEQYEFCPCCKTDEGLELAQPGPSFSFNSITGEKVDNTTGLPVWKKYPDPPPVPRYKSPFIDLTNNKSREEVARAEDLAIEAYREAYVSGGEQAGYAAYKKSLMKGK